MQEPVPASLSRIRGDEDFFTMSVKPLYKEEGGFLSPSKVKDLRYFIM